MPELLTRPTARPLGTRYSEPSVLSWDNPDGRESLERPNATFADVGLAFRRARPGAELDLLDAFIAQFPYLAPADCQITVFREPRLSSGFPDAVAVVWSPSATLGWEQQREDLTAADLRVMQLLVTQGHATRTALLSLIGRRVSASLERLLAAGLAAESRDGWHARPLHEVFAVRDIIAVEAKIAQWTGAIDQATRNTWFASRSYVLLPQLPKNDDVLRRAASQGVGVWTLRGGAAVRELESHKGPMPRSYASWLFNEWVWRVANRTGGTLSSGRTTLGERR